MVLQVYCYYMYPYISSYYSRKSLCFVFLELFSKHIARSRFTCFRIKNLVGGICRTLYKLMISEYLECPRTSKIEKVSRDVQSA